MTRPDEISDPPTYYDRQGNPLTLLEWAQMFGDRLRDLRRVAEEWVGTVHVSTIWLGIDQSFGHGPPLIFETMIFGDIALDQEQWRYSTEAAALAGHEATVQLVRLELDVERVVE